MPKRYGLRLNIVRDGGGAMEAGLAVGDVLLQHGDVMLDSPDALTRAREALSEPAEIVFVRDGQSFVTALGPGKLDVSFGVVEIEIAPNASLIPYSPSYETELANELARRSVEMVITTAHAVDGFKATRQLGVITAECVFGLNLFKDFFNALTDIFGGRSGSAQSALRDARETCLAELKKEALARGANAVIAVDLDYSEFSGQRKSMLFLVASGTAVFIERHDD